MARGSWSSDGWGGGHWIRDDLRWAILLRDGFRCAWCREIPGYHPCNPRDRLSLDHLVSREEAERAGMRPDNRPSNLVAACVPCNQRRSDQDWRTYLGGVRVPLIRFLVARPVDRRLGDLAYRMRRAGLSPARVLENIHIRTDRFKIASDYLRGRP